MQQFFTHNFGLLRWPTAVIIGLCLSLAFIVPICAQQATEPTTKTAEPNYANDPYWQHAKQEVYKSVLELMAQHKNELLQGIQYHKLTHGNITRKQIALTFDDGPHPLYTPQILDILAKEKVKATFFVIGEMADKYPNLVQAELNAEHNIGNHTYHHVNLTKILEPDIATEIKACGEALQRITGKAPYLFRPPGGDYDTGVAATSEALGYTIVLWTDDPGDYASPGEQVILQRALKQARNGGIILIHDGVQQTINILPKLITTLKKQGYQFVAIDEMMKERP
ncbi:MAG TPA: polysaccharide deacetylase family protein [Armatimonadota bacterium]|jgi:polysaccharide deacetylase family sporulation protein PdaB